jgi:hypothetical protein
MEVPIAWFTCDQFARFKTEALGREPHAGADLHERMLERVAMKLGLRIELQPADPEPLMARSARVRVVAQAGVALEGSYGEALAWLMAGAPDAESMALARAERAALGAEVAGAAKCAQTGRL